MIAAVIALAVLFAGTVYLLISSHREAQAQWVLERRELLNRIQAPQHIPLGSVSDFVVPEREEDGTELVGTIAEPKPDDPPAV
jgi:hypothetical protein